MSIALYGWYHAVGQPDDCKIGVSGLPEQELMSQITTSARKQGRPQGDQDLRRQEVADAVWAVLRTEGLDGTTMRAVARQAGFTTGVLSHYFRNKDELLSFSINHLFDQMQARWEKFIAELSPLEAISAIALSVLPTSEQAQLEWTAWLGFASRSPWVPIFAELRERRSNNIRSVIGLLLQQAIDRGDLHPELNVKERADTVVAFVEGMCIVNTTTLEESGHARRQRLLMEGLAMLLPRLVVGEDVDERFAS